MKSKQNSGIQNARSGREYRPGTAALICCLLLVSSVGIYAQGSGVVDGKLVNGTDASITPAKVAVEVVGLGGGMTVLKTTTTDAQGKFRVDGLPTDQPIMIRANYKSANYHAMANFDSTGKSQVEIKVFETTTSMKGIRAEGARMAFQLAGDRLQALETISFNNQTNPPRTFMSPDGNYRFSKAPGILEPPQVNVTGPGSAMPLDQSPLESADGKSYYSLYPLRPGTTTFEVQEQFPYTGKTYTYRKHFYEDVDSIEIGVIPQDMTVSAPGLTRIQTDPQRNFAVYSGGPVRAGSEVVWTFSGGTPAAEPAPAESMGGSEPAASGSVKPAPTDVGRYAFIIGPLLLMGLVVVLWFAYNHMKAATPGSDPRARELKERREQLLTYLADLDRRYESQAIDKRDYLRQRESGKRQLRRIALISSNTKTSGTAAHNS